MKVVQGLSSWSLLGVFLAALVVFGAYMYGGFDTRSANQAGGEYVIPKLEVAQLEVAQLTQPSEEPSQSTSNSSSDTEAAEYTLSAEDHTLSAKDTLPISNDSGSTEPRTGSAVPTEAPSSGDPLMFSEAPSSSDPLMFSEAPVAPLPVQAAGISTPPADSCTSQIWCANPAHQLPNQANVTSKTASSCTDDNGEDSCSKKKPSKQKPKAEQGQAQRGDYRGEEVPQA